MTSGIVCLTFPKRKHERFGVIVTDGISFEHTGIDLARKDAGNDACQPCTRLQQ